jgi:hypothetical protein
VVTIKGPIVRDSIQWGIGAAIGVNETLIRHGEPRLAVLAFSGILMGIPAVIGLLHLPGAPGGEKTLVTPEQQSSSQLP